MSEYWVSKKKYFCKYCEIYIADDAPSRQQHENGLRHKGNVERFIRSIYKSGEKQKKEREEEKRDMARVEQAANAAFAQDIGAGLAKSVVPVASSTKQLSVPKPSNPYTNYSTAESLGYKDPDAERAVAEREIRQSQGIAGEWQMLTPPPSHAESLVPNDDIKSGILSEESTMTGKRPAGVSLEDDARSFKLQKKTLGTGLGEVYDPGIISVPPRKKEENEMKAPPFTLPSQSGKEQRTELPKWTSLQWKRPSESAHLQEADQSTKHTEIESSTASTSLMVDEFSASRSTSASAEKSSSKWVKVDWSTSTIEEPASSASSGPSVVSEAFKTEEAAPNIVGYAKEEPSQQGIPLYAEQNTGSLFKKRKAPANAGRGRRP